MIYSCEAHVEEGLEEVLIDEGPPPAMEKTSAAEEPCFLCGKKAVYQIEEPA
ncbi:CxxH/CxxC protein [Alkalicoccus daliensis]|uniref:CxxH/CxxC protein, BA_5709 family n=1 Tax=Alkalicoccus daliensis TaxID=745820 RepID=A0A1H0FR85_9BACI|nr:CxxH/CxxC protein [Alkalicoccus daliensis]SDN97094.1 CxxH/CxxC protein, BA_5709 family [Alkalicoccus daliensis]